MSDFEIALKSSGTVRGLAGPGPVALCLAYFGKSINPSQTKGFNVLGSIAGYMQPTRQTVVITAIGVLLAVAAPILFSPLPAVGAAFIFGWLIARQVIAVRQYETTVNATTISVEPAVSTVEVGTEIPVTLTVERPLAAAETTQTVTLDLPVAAKQIEEANRQLTLPVGETHASKTVTVSIPTAGRMRFPEPRWELIDTQDNFVQTLDRGPTPTVTVEAETVQNMHVGRGGSELSAFGQHATGGTGDGLTPAELREYIGGDPADRIDWKATARLPDTYVREFEAESDREINLIVDHRSQTGDPATKETQFSYLREVALSITGNAEAAGDPLGLLTVGDEGLTATITPTRNEIGYTRIREQLLTLEPTPAGPPSSAVDFRHPAATRRLIYNLADDKSKFGTILRQFAETTPTYVKQLNRNPLYGAVEYLQSTTWNTQLTIIVTTDSDRQQLQQTVQAATSNDSAVLVFMTPEVLFDPGGLQDLESAYDRYRSFEEFRTQLEQLGAVVAYEVGPGDRLATLLASDKAEATTRRTQTEAIQ